MRRIIGIDLGTTNSAAAFIEGGEPVLIPNDRGSRITPSVVAFTEGGDILVGESAKNQAVINAERTILAVKRSMGEPRRFPIGKRNYSPEEISSFILRKLKKDAESHLGEEVREAVVTVPAHFSEIQRRATVEAGKMAGLKIRRVLNEPTAAALSYAYRTDGLKKILVYDLGGGTFDGSCLLKQGKNFTVKSTAGNNNLGGIDFDNRLLEKVLDKFENDSGLELKSDKIVVQQLREQVENAKIELSSRESAEIDTLILSGGSSRIPMVRSRLLQEFHHSAGKREGPSEMEDLKDKLNSLLDRVVKTADTYSEYIERNLRREIDDIVASTKSAVLKNDFNGMKRSRTALEIIIGELNECVPERGVTV